MTDKTIEFLEKGPDAFKVQQLKTSNLESGLARTNRHLLIVAGLLTLSMLLLALAVVFCWSMPRGECRCQRVSERVLFVEGGGR